MKILIIRYIDRLDQFLPSSWLLILLTWSIRHRIAYCFSMLVLPWCNKHATIPKPTHAIPLSNKLKKHAAPDREKKKYIKKFEKMISPSRLGREIRGNIIRRNKKWISTRIEKKEWWEREEKLGLKKKTGFQCFQQSILLFNSNEIGSTFRMPMRVSIRRPAPSSRQQPEFFSSIIKILYYID